MDIAIKQSYLAQAEEHVAQGEKHIARQRGIIAQIERRGDDSQRARELLRLFEDTQKLHIADRDRLRQELGY